MEVSMTQVAVSAALSVVLGVAMGVVYDLIRFARLVFGVNVGSPFKGGSRFRFLGYFFVCITDLLFFAILTISMCVFFFLTGDGRMRSYGLCGTFLGFLLYYNTIGRLFISVSSFLVAVFKRAVKYVFRLLSAPFVFSFLWVKKTVLQILSLPIVISGVKRYNIYINKCRKKAAYRARQRKMKKGGCVFNGGAHGEKIK